MFVASDIPTGAQCRVPFISPFEINPEDRNQAVNYDTWRNSLISASKTGYTANRVLFSNATGAATTSTNLTYNDTTGDLFARSKTVLEWNNLADNILTVRANDGILPVFLRNILTANWTNGVEISAQGLFVAQFRKDVIRFHIQNAGESNKTYNFVDIAADGRAGMTFGTVNGGMYVFKNRVLAGQKIVTFGEGNKVGGAGVSGNIWLRDNEMYSQDFVITNLDNGDNNALGIYSPDFTSFYGGTGYGFGTGFFDISTTKRVAGAFSGTRAGLRLSAREIILRGDNLSGLNNSGAAGFHATWVSGGTQIGFFGATPVVRQTVSAAATDPTTTQTLVNDIRTALINLGLLQ